MLRSTWVHVFCLFFSNLGEPTPLMWHIGGERGSGNDNVLLRSFCGNRYTHITPQHRQLHAHHSTVLTYNPQKKCAGTHRCIMDHKSPSAIQSHGRQGQPATQSHPSPALIITLGPHQRESGSPGPQIVARKRLYKAKSLCNPILIQACILLSGWEKYSSGLSRKAGVSVNACQRA